MATDTTAAVTAPPATLPSGQQPHPLLTSISRTLSPALLHRISTSPILLIGAGGIGCELLKNLALSGFRNVTIVDLDTIDVSNLNRQFLFRSNHVGMAKCSVAAEVGRSMAPDSVFVASSPGAVHADDAAVPSPAADAIPSPAAGSAEDDQEVKYTAIHGNVCDTTKFNVEYLSRFALVLNALDNVTARRRVNRLCLAAKIPLIEAGTTGYLGQVTVIDKPSQVECYECQTKPTQKVYPICTIRSTPSMPVHCIVWAKEFWKLCFGDKVEDSMLFEDDAVGAGEAGTEEDVDGDNKDGNSEGKDGEGNDDDDDIPNTGPSTYMDAVLQLRTLLKSATTDDDVATTTATPTRQVQDQAVEVLTALYATEINKQIDMGRYKTAAKVPAPLTPEDLNSDSASTSAAADAVLKPPTARDGYQPTDVWSKQECSAELISCIVQAHQMYTSPDDGETVSPTFDKDDDMAMRFVTAAANLRQYVFKIDPIQSLYSAKGIAGNIIPAIATTNAIVAGLQVLQAFHILRVQMEAEQDGGGADEKEKKEAEGRYKSCCRLQYCLRNPTRKGYLLQPTLLPDPNPGCFVCRSATVTVTLDTSSWKMDGLLKTIIKGELGFAEPTILINGDLVYEEGDGAEEDYVCNLPKTLEMLPAGGIKGGTVVRVEDFTQDLEVDLSFVHRDDWEEDEAWKDKDPEQRYIVGGDRPVAAAAAAAPSAAPASSAVDGDATAEEKKEEENPTKQQEEDDDDDDLVIVEDTPAAPLVNGVISKKRKASTTDEDGADAKKPKAVDVEDDDVEVIEVD